MRRTDHLGGITAFLGIKFFQRSIRSLSLTPDGEIFLMNCQNAIDILEQAEADLTSHIAYPSGRLRVDLIEASIDLAIRIGELSDSCGLVARRLTVQKLIICASPDSLRSNGEPINGDKKEY
ncbi:Substrate-binding transcriptional regulator, LysR family (fragment) [Xenorhabdus nematophila str. Websteri]